MHKALAVAYISYLTGRSLYVALDETCSSTKPIKCGIPQGSLIGPRLLIICMHVISNVSTQLDSTFYIMLTIKLLKVLV